MCELNDKWLLYPSAAVDSHIGIGTVATAKLTLIPPMTSVGLVPWGRLLSIAPIRIIY